MYFLKGILPWQGLKVNKDEDRYRIIYEKKKNTKPEELCAGFPGMNHINKMNLPHTSTILETFVMNKILIMNI